jgi:cytochrome b561
MTSKPFVPTWPRFMDGVLGWFFGGFALLMMLMQLIGWFLSRNSTESTGSFFGGVLTVFAFYEGRARLISFAHAKRVSNAETPVLCNWTIVPKHTIEPSLAHSETTPA